MKKCLWLVVFFILVLSAKGQQSESKGDTAITKTLFGIKCGINISSFNTSVNSETKPKLGFNIGFYLKTPITYRFSFRPEIYYSNQGQKDNYVASPSGPLVGSTVTNMHYINVPLLFEQGRKVSFQFGPQLGVLIKSSEKGTIASTKIDDDLSDVMTKADLGIVLGMGFSPGKRFSCGLRYNIGLTDVYIGDDDASYNVDYPKISNRVFHFYVATSF